MSDVDEYFRMYESGMNLHEIGLCFDKHYTTIRYHMRRRDPAFYFRKGRGDPGPGGLRKCIRCKIDMVADAPRRGNYCKTCVKSSPTRINARCRQYGILPEVYYTMLAQQEGRCSGCSEVFESLGEVPCIDHCHTTGKVRGLLCSGCNSILGFAKDNPKTLERLIVYLTL